MATLNGNFWHCEGPGSTRISGVQVDVLMQLDKHFLHWFCSISATKKPAP